MLRRVFVLVLALALASRAGAIVSNPLPRVCNEFPRSTFVFSGTVLSDTYRWREMIRGDPAEVYRIRVNRVFKGNLPRIVPLYTAVDSGRGVLTVGQPAVVFASRQLGRIAFDGSSNSQSGPGSAKVIAEIRDYLARPPRTATIAGRVDHDGPLQNVRLLVSDGSTKLFVRTDAKGRFFVAVRPGRWSVRIAEPGWASRNGPYSFDLVERLILEEGNCADVQIETAAPNEKPPGAWWERWPR